jgi:hypothetical protein
MLPGKVKKEGPETFLFVLPFRVALLNQKHGNANAGVQRVKQEVLAIDIVDVAVVVV